MQTILLLGNEDSDLTAYKTLRSIFYSIASTKATDEFNLVCPVKYSDTIKRLTRQFIQQPNVIFFSTDTEAIKIICNDQAEKITILRVNDLVSDNFFIDTPNNTKISIPEHTLLIDQNILRTNRVPKDWLEILSPDTLLTGITYEGSIFRKVFSNLDLGLDALMLSKYICCTLLYTYPDIEPAFRNNVIYCCRDSKVNNKLWLTLTNMLLPNVTKIEKQYVDEAGNIKTNQQTKTLKKSLKQTLKAVTSKYLNESTTSFIKDSISSARSFKTLRKTRRMVTNSERKWNKELITTWSSLNDIEPLIRPSREKLANCIVDNESDDSLFSIAFERCIGRLQTSEHIVLVPHLNKGGADLAALHLVNTIGDNYKTVMFATGYTNSEWFSRVGQNVECLEAIDLFQGISEEKRLVLLTMLLQFVSPKFLSVINSYQGYQLLKEYQEQIPQQTKVFLHTYAFDMTEEGYIYNHIEDGIPKTYPRVDHYITDSNTYKEQLTLVQGIPPELVSCVYLPINMNTKEKRATNKTRRVLWASRVSSAKLVEVAVGVAEILSKHNIEVDFYGVIEPDYQKQNKFLKMLEKIPSVHYRGSFDGFDTIPHENYDVFLLTTKNEGMPNVVIEAVTVNHYVVAPPVGGIPEVITQGVNGGLVKDKFRPESYANEVLSYYSKTIDEKYTTDRQKLNKRVISNHNKKNYKANLLKLYN